MKYQDILAYIESISPLGSRPGLDAVYALHEKLNHPQDKLNYIHIAGTNGKGSIGSFLQHTIFSSGLKVGFFSSPACNTPRDMIRINCDIVSEELFCRAASCVIAAREELVAQNIARPTEFEFLVAVANLIFLWEECDLVIMEVGMGGRLDATNIMKKPLVSVITRIDYDHTAFLGNTLENITEEKCGIIKENCPVVLYPCQEEEVFSLVKTISAQKNAALFLPDLSCLTVEERQPFGSRFSYKEYRNLKISLCGDHQIYNAITALTVLSVLREKGYSLPDETIQKGLLECTWQGRFELLQDNPPIILDGAHNLNGARAFSQTIATYFPQNSFVGIVAMLKDKDYTRALQEFSAVSSHIIVTEFEMERCAKKEDLFLAASTLGIQVSMANSPREAVARALAIKKEDEGVFCVGSLYALPAYRKAFSR